MADSLFNEDSKNIVSKETLSLGEGRSENLEKMGNNRDIYCYVYRGLVNVNFKREYQSLPPGTRIFVMPQLSYMLDQILGNKMKKLNFQAII